MSEGGQWVLALGITIMGALFGVLVAMAIMAAADWLKGAMHRRRTQRQRYTWK